MKKITSIGIIIMSAAAMAQASAVEVNNNVVAKESLINKPEYSENIAKIFNFADATETTADYGQNAIFCQELMMAGAIGTPDWIIFGCN